MGNALKKAFYIFLLGLTTYAWWKVSSAIKRKLEEVDEEGAAPSRAEPSRAQV